MTLKATLFVVFISSYTKQDMLCEKKENVWLGPEIEFARSKATRTRTKRLDVLRIEDEHRSP